MFNTRAVPIISSNSASIKSAMRSMEFMTVDFAILIPMTKLKAETPLNNTITMHRSSDTGHADRTRCVF